MKLIRYQLYLCASVCVLTPILAYLFADYLLGTDSDLYTAYLFGDGCMPDWWIELQFDSPLRFKLYCKFRAIRRCFQHVDKCGFGDWQLPFENLIDTIELLVTDAVHFLVSNMEALHAVVSEWTLYKLTVNIWTGGILLFYIITYAVLLPLRAHLFDQLMLNKLQPYTFKTSLIFDGKTITILERAKL